LDIHRATGGAFDITSGPLSKAWGFFRRAGTMPSDEQIAEAVARVGGGFVELDPQHLTVRFLKPGLEVNVNSIGKGYALDRAADALTEAGIDDFLFHGGQSSVLARGDHAAGQDAGWPVGLRHPMRPEQRIAEFYLRDEALGTSGSGTQFFRHQGRRYGHLLDPRTGHPAEGVYSSTVLAPTAAEADALATAFYVMGPEAALEYCRSRPELGMLLVCPGARGGALAFHAAGLDSRRYHLLNEA
jgi:thiamine biosynthesis lipoprotein